MKRTRSFRWIAGTALLVATLSFIGDAPLAVSRGTPTPAALGGPQTGTGTTDVTRSALPPPPIVPPARGGGSG
ncbi:MAG: hypothetical protein JNL90_12575 [Planctomycetes bacterium]|nr:hypothetical protein [Planctomycetota bacterium]